MANNIVAAKDTTYQLTACRTLPIAESVTAVAGYPAKLKIYLTRASKFWQVRCYLKGRVYTKSTRTTNQRLAINAAKDFYEQLVASYYSHQHNLFAATDKELLTFDVLAERVIAQERDRVVRSELAEMTYRNNRQRLRKYWMAMFGKRKIQDITHHDIVKAVGVLSQRGIGAISMTQYLQCLRSVFNYARAENLITHVPLFPKLRKATTSRGGFTVNEYRQLVRAAKKLSELQDAKSVSHRSRAGGVYTKTVSVPKEIAWLIVFMVNGFMRPSDVIHIQHQHVQVVRGEHLYLRLTLPETKRHKAQIVTLPSAVRVYERLLNYMQAQGMGKPEDYVFLPELKRRDVAGRMMAEHFNKVLVATGLRLGQLGQTRTLYSLRHTAIMFRLLYGRGIDLLTLARNARTSVQMIEKFYAANLTAEMNIDLIQGRRG